MSLYYNIGGIVMDTVTPDDLGVVWSVAVLGWDRPDTTEVWNKRPNADGASRSPGSYNTRDLTCKIWAEGPDAAAIYQARQRVLELFDINTRVMVTEIDGAGYNCLGYPSGALYIQHPQPHQMDINLLIRCPDPRKYGPMESEQIHQGSAAPGLFFPVTFPLTLGNTSSGITVRNTGPTETPILAKFYGPLQSQFWLINRRRGQRIAFNLNIADGDYLAVNTSPGIGSARLNDQSSRRGYLTFDSRLFLLDPGDTELEFGSDVVTTGYVDLQFAPASLG